MAAEVTLNPTADTYNNDNNATTNYGSGTTFRIGEDNDQTGEWGHAFIKFDLGVVGGCNISTAKLRLYCVTDKSSNVRTFHVYRLLKNWVEGQLTYNVYATGSNWDSEGGFNATDCNLDSIGSREFSASEVLNEYKEWTLDASAIMAMANGTNYGFLITDPTKTGNDAYYFNSREAESNKPELVITYDPITSFHPRALFF